MEKYFCQYSKVIDWVTFDETCFSVYHNGEIVDISTIKETDNYRSLLYNAYEQLDDSLINFAIDCIMTELLEKGYIICGDTHQKVAIPVLSGNNFVLLSQHEWAKIMADVMNFKEGNNKYTYLDFFSSKHCPIDEKLP